MARYSDEELRRLLELWRREDARLSVDQMEAVVEWEETPEDVREELRPAIEAGRQHAARTAPGPLTPDQAEELRKVERRAEQTERPSLLRRLRSFLFS